jgi:thiol-disulfide isomerase/thioredoxin
MRFKCRKVKIQFFTVMLILVGFTILVSCQTNETEIIPSMSFDELEPMLQQTNDTVYIFNFWATWCKPCITELPAFEKINKEYEKRKVKVYLVSIDFPNKHEELLLPFIKNNHIRSSVVHLTDTDANLWIDKVSPQWSGSIPATLVYKGNSREFYEKSLSYVELKNIVESKI